MWLSLKSDNSTCTWLLQRRLSAFALVCESHKTSGAINAYEFTWVSEFVRDNSYHAEPSFRQQMLSHLKHFFYHLLESGRKLDSNGQRPHQVTALTDEVWCLVALHDEMETKSKCNGYSHNIALHVALILRLAL